MREKSIEELEKLGQQNNIEAIYELGQRYYKGLGVEQDYTKAFNIFKKLFNENNYENALRIIAGMYFYGKGVEVDYVKARECGKLYLEHHRDTYIEYYLGEIYFYGLEVEKDYKKAKDYFEKSIEEKYDDAYFYLGEIYKNGGYGIESDVKKAEEYFSKIEIDLCKASIYYALAFKNNENAITIQELLDFINKDRKILNSMENYIPFDHPSVINYNKLRYLRDKQYESIVNSLKNKLEEYDLKASIPLTYFNSDEDIEVLSEFIVCSYKSDKLSMYLIK